MVVDDGAEQSSHISVICSSYMRDMFKCQVYHAVSTRRRCAVMRMLYSGYCLNPPRLRSQRATEGHIKTM